MITFFAKTYLGVLALASSMTLWIAIVAIVHPEIMQAAVKHYLM